MADPADAFRRQVGAAAMQLINNTSTKPLDEKIGAKDWTRLRLEWLNAAAAAGPDFVAALLYPQNIPAAADYTQAQVLDTTEAGAPTETIVHVRQRALLSWLRAALPAGSESLRLVI